METTQNVVQYDEKVKYLEGELAAAHRTIKMLLDQADGVPANDEMADGPAPAATAKSAFEWDKLPSIVEEATGGIEHLHAQIAFSQKNHEHVHHWIWQGSLSYGMFACDCGARDES